MSAPTSARPAEQPSARSSAWKATVPSAASTGVESRNVVNEKPPSAAKSVPHAICAGGNVELQLDTAKPVPASRRSTLKA